MVWDWDTEVAEPTIIPLLNQTVSVTLSKLPQNLVAQTLHLTLLLYYFRNKTLTLVMRPTPIVSCPFLLPQEGRTALMCASENEHVNVVEKLLAAGANPDNQDEVRNFVTRVIC